MVSMTLFACDKEETDNKDKLDNDDKITTSIVYEKDITDTSKNGYMDQFNEYNYIEEEDALALTYSKTDFEINFDGTIYDAGINIKWPYQENKQYKNLIYDEK